MYSKSAVDRRYKAVVYGASTFMFVIASLLALFASFSTVQIILAYTAVLLASSFLFWLLYGTYYVLRDKYLYCRSGPFAIKIRYDKIKYLSLADNLYFSMALSPRKIEIKRSDKGRVLGTVMISPENIEIFNAHLWMRCRYLVKAS